MRIFCLDDEIDFHPRRAIVETLSGHDLTIARNINEAKKVYAHPYDLLLLDHDMEGFFEDSNHPNTGYQFCVWLVEQQVPKVPTLLHSQNNVGRDKMWKLLTNNDWHVSGCPFSHGYLELLKSKYRISQ